MSYNRFFSTQMGLSGMNLSISRSFFNMFIYLIVVCCSSWIHASFPTTIATSRLGGNETDRLALLAFKHKITDDPLQVMSSWNESIHFCQWGGVTCGRRHQRVTMLVLQSQKLFGSISPHVGNLSFLRVLDLRNNSFGQEIPPELGHLQRLRSLSLHNNSFSGKIPSNLSSCSNLDRFHFGNNKLVGEIPAELGSLSKLRAIVIEQNNLTGEIPHSFVNLSSLEALFATTNNFRGSLPDSLGQLKYLTVISFGDNRLSGTIPPSIFNLSSLTVLDVPVNNQIIGSLPSNIGITLPNLQYLGIAFNQFTGSIPASISNASNLEVFEIAGNNLTGKVPTMERLHKLELVNLGFNHLGSGGADDFRLFSSLTNATNLKLLITAGNNFGGVLPESISNLSTKLEWFSISDNHLFGSIPSGIGNLINLNRLSMRANQFTGNIPIDIGKLQNLNELSFAYNSLSGYIPSSLGNLSEVTAFSFESNNLSGSIPTSLGKCQNLLLLDLSTNSLSGTIPRQVFSLSSLSIYLDLSKNSFTGSLPIEVGNLTNLGRLDVSENMLSGEIPKTIGSCVTLEFLCMEGNFFQGSIPSSFSSLRAIQDVDLSRNNLSGKIPKCFEAFNLLQNLNLSYNDFEGMVPLKGVFVNATAVSVIGNSKLCGGIPELELPKCILKGSTKRKSTINLKLIVPTALGLIGLALVVFFLFLCSRRKKTEESSSGNSGRLFLTVSYQSLHKATDGFGTSNLIGAGSFGSVYKGILELDGKQIAVKVLNLLRRGASKSFTAECEALRNIRHRNLVKVLSACSGVDYQGNDFKALVYEFMVNGNLDEWLHPILGEYEEPKNLSLVQRLNIAIDVACALDYLHHHCQTPIVHCDLKPNNVLLDNEMTAHVSDFGLARFLVDANYNNNAEQTSSIGIRGSVGYTAPEYGMGSEVSTSGDVYSYGILLLEMFTGKRPTDEMFSDGLNLHNYVKMALPERVEVIADPILIQQGEEEVTSTSTNTNRYQSHASSHKIQECLISIFGIGMTCSAELPSERLDVSDVVAKLNVIRGNLLGMGGIHGGRRNTTTVQS